ncbi:DUF1273 domain-containing protein [Enterococcus sp. BWB1-3]|uniref:SLOG family protein n=1 Tax=unclassified Enterococcus TaxID=2608891 RepID=UPI001924575A|nr:MULTISPECIES: DUF1273 domain-containing protein [unclassified Enterococcus]MBL1228425.1 DUF1273 domain-containing protein [Enterococcus sp. BWB1-3]MCB5954318.1 DUF1273 domain-containing protein [Enterococcus sp. CWB-B31]
MNPLKTVFITGYRSFELNVFQENDPKAEVIKKVLKSEIINFLEEGAEWFLVSGNLGIELWAGEVIIALKKEYEINLGVIYPFQGFGENWNEKNRQLLEKVEGNADYVDYVSRAPYQSPAQLKSHTSFILEHTQASLLIYDKEYPGKTLFFEREAENFSEAHSYEIRMISMDDLQNFA